VYRSFFRSCLLEQLEAERERVWQAYEAGRITRQDYEAYVESGEPPAKAQGSIERPYVTQGSPQAR
jgi:hypothetical protein